MSLSQPVPLDQLVNTGSTVTIEETTSTIPGGQPRKVVLVGPSLPRKGGAKWGGDLRLITKWYPGNGIEGTQQNLGATELPSEWNGVWNRTRMGRTPAVFYDETGRAIGLVEPFDLFEILDAIRLGGARLRVTWAVSGRRMIGTKSNAAFASDRGADQAVDRKIVREGRMKSLTITPDTEVDIPWEMNFEWVSRGGRQAKASDVRHDDDLEKATSAVANSINALDYHIDTKIVSIRADKRLAASSFTLGQLETLANAPKKLVDAAMSKLRYNVNQFKRVVNIARTLQSAPTSMANSVLDFARNTTGVANKLVTDLGRTPPELLANRQKVSDLVKAARYFGRISNGMVSTARAGAATEDRLRAFVTAGANQGTISVRESSTTRAGDVVAIHVVRAGETPTSLSSKFYGNPDHGAEILRANRLPTHTPTLRAGSIVVIPALVSAARPQ